MACTWGVASCATVPLQGQYNRVHNLLDDYLPASHMYGEHPYSESGALYAIGLMNSDCGHHMIPFLREALDRSGANDIVQHGAALGLGLCGIGSADTTLVDRLLDVGVDDAVAGEAAGLAIGMVMCGTADGEVLAGWHLK